MYRFFQIFIIVILTFIWVAASGQSPIKRIGIDQGLSNETIRSIYQDKKGFMWFGTLDGLNRFDGYRFKTYHNKFGDTSSLVSSVIYGITEDKSGNIWLGTRLGVCRLNGLSDNFTTVHYRSGQGKLVKFDREVIKTIKCDSNNNILIASELQGLIISRNAVTVADQIPFINKENQRSYQYGVQDICFDKNGRTLVFVQGHGLCALDEQKQSLRLLDSDLKYATKLLPDGDNVWIASTTGVYVYSLWKGNVEQVMSVSNGKLLSNFATSLSSDVENIYVGTMGGGVSILNKASKQVQFLTVGDGASALTSGGIYYLYNDNAARLWIGTRRGGINIRENHSNGFKTISRIPGNSNSLSGNFITSLCELPDGQLLIGTEESGLNVYDQKTNRFIHFKNNPQVSTTIAADNVNNIAIDYLGKVWIATYTNGICRFDLNSGKFRRYRTYNSKARAENNVFNTLYEDKARNLWASALRMGNYFGALYI